MIKKLLDKNKKKRLGAVNDMKEVLSHPFFNGIDIEKLLNKQLVPPYQPEINDDLKYFDQKLTSREDFAESVIDDTNRRLILKNADIFKDL